MNSCTADLTEVTVKPFFFSLLTCIRGGCLPAVLKPIPNKQTIDLRQEDLGEVGRPPEPRLLQLTQRIG